MRWMIGTRNTAAPTTANADTYAAATPLENVALGWGEVNVVARSYTENNEANNDTMQHAHQPTSKPRPLLSSSGLLATQTAATTRQGPNRFTPGTNHDQIAFGRE